MLRAGKGVQAEAGKEEDLRIPLYPSGCGFRSRGASGRVPGGRKIVGPRPRLLRCRPGQGPAIVAADPNSLLEKPGRQNLYAEERCLSAPPATDHAKSDKTGTE
jgi:hypothetical protein